MRIAIVSLVFFAPSFLLASHIPLAPSYTTKTLKLSFSVQAPDCIYQEYFNFTVDHPQVEITSINYSDSPETRYNQDLAEEKKVFTKSFSITLTLVIHKFVTNAHVYVTYFKHSRKYPAIKVIDLNNSTDMHEISLATVIDVINPIQKKELPLTWHSSPAHAELVDLSTALQQLSAFFKSSYFYILLLTLISAIVWSAVPLFALFLFGYAIFLYILCAYLSWYLMLLIIACSSVALAMALFSIGSQCSARRLTLFFNVIGMLLLSYACIAYAKAYANFYVTTSYAVK